MASIFTRRFAFNYFSTLLFIIGSYSVIKYLSGFHKGMMNAILNLESLGIPVHLEIHSVFVGLMIFYAVVLIPFYARYPWLHSKAFVFLRGLFMGLRRGKVTGKVKRTRKSNLPAGAIPPLPLPPIFSRMTKQAGLALFLKFFFAPLMINWCLAHIHDMLNNVVQVVWGIQAERTGRILFDNGLFWACFQLILFIDTLLFTLGYIIEMPSLKNRIKTVEPTLLGWFVCLACYPPFNESTGRFLEWHSNDFPHFQSDTIHLTMNIIILIAMAIYSWASVALGFKASNLTNRGIISHGPYAFVRHPAYMAKNFAWWIGAIPTLLYVAYPQGTQALLYGILATAGWSFIYFMRAITEERHLLIANNGYAEYMKKVKYRFIPGVI